MAGLVSAAKMAAAAFASAFVVKWAKDAVQEIANVGDRFDKLAKRTGFLAKDLQGLEHAAELSGASLGSIETALRRLQASQVEAGEGLKTYTREFDRLGINIKDSQGNFKDTTELFFEVADGMKGMKTDAERTAVATKLLGRSGAQLIPMLKEGGDSIRAMVQEMHDLGGVMDDELIAQSAEWVDNQRRMDVTMRSIKMTIAKELLPWMNRAARGTLEWWKANKDWIRQRIGEVFEKVAQVVGRMSEFFGKLAGNIAKLIDKLPGFVKDWGVLIGVLWGVVAVLRAGAWGRWFIGLALLVLVLEDIQAYLEGQPSLLGKIIKKLEEWTGIDITGYLNEAREGYRQFISDLEKAGEDTTPVWKELWLSWVTAVQTAVNDMKIAWQQFFMDIVAEAGAGWTRFLEAAILGMDNIKAEWVAKWTALKTWFMDNFISPIASGIRGVFSLGENLRGGGRIELADIGSLLGAAQLARPGAGVGAGGGPSVSQNTKIDVSVNASPGMNEGQLATEVGRQVQKHMARVNRDAMGAIVPKAAALVPGV